MIAINQTSVINNHFGFYDSFALNLPSLLYHLSNSLLLLVLLCLLLTDDFDLIFLKVRSFFKLSLLYLKLL